MREKEILAKLKTIPNGRFFKMEWETYVPVAKKYEKIYTVKKRVSSTVRKGIQYTNTKKYKEKVSRTEQVLKEIGIEAQQVHDKLTKLPWGQWLIPNLLIEHINKSGKYNLYLRVYTTTNKPEVDYYVNGRYVSQTKLKEMGIINNSYWNKSLEDGVFTINTDNIISIGSSNIN